MKLNESKIFYDSKISKKKYYLTIFLLTFFYSPQLFSTDFLITVSGHYQLGSNLPSNGDVNGTIRIQASYVTLDLGNYTVFQGDSSSNASGIVVDANLTNITITNGTVFNFTGTGIAIQPGCQKVIIDNILTDSCFAVGIALQGTSANPIGDSIIKNSRIISCSNTFRATPTYVRSLPPVWLINNQRSQVLNCTFSLTGTLQKDFPGDNQSACITLEGCQACVIENIKFLKNNDFGSVSLGTDTVATNGCTVRNCLTIGSDSVLASLISYGTYSVDLYSIISGSYNVFEDCSVIESTFSGNYDDTTGTALIFSIKGNPLYGFLNATYNTFRRCSYIGNAPPLSNIVGNVFLCLDKFNTFVDCTCSSNNINTNQFFVVTDDNTLARCVSTRNTVTYTNGSAASSFLLQGSNCEMRDCESSNNSFSGSGSSSGLIINGSRNQIIGCSFFRNNGNTDANSFGISNTGSNNLFLQNVAFANGPTNPLIENQLSGLSVGSYSTPGRGGAGNASTRMNTMRNAWTNLRITN